MTNRKRTYSKANLQISVEGSPKRLQIDSTEPKVVWANAPVGYKKEEPTKDPRYFIVIISGGEIREKNYFKIISDANRFTAIKVEFNADPNRLNPERMLEFSKYLQERYQSSESNNPDDYFLVSDVDHFMDELIEIKPKCDKLGLQLVVSNPCFEVWLYYSKRTDKLVNYPIPDEVEKISKKLKTWIATSSEIRGGIDPIKAIFDIEHNIVNAKANYAIDEKNLPELFSTSMFLLAQKILPFISKDLTKLKEENKQRAQQYRQQNAPPLTTE